MKKLIAIATLSILSTITQAQSVQTQTIQEQVYQSKDVEKVSDLPKGQWNYFKLNEGTIAGKIATRVQDSENKSNVAILFSKFKDTEKGLVEYPLIVIATEKSICKSCDVKVSFDNKTYENYKIQEIESNEYKLANTGKFYKNFSETKEVFIDIPKLGKYQYHYDNLNFDMPKTSWFHFDVVIPDLKVPFKVSTLEENNTEATLSIYTSEDNKKTVGILINDEYQCKANACVLNVTFDNVKKTFSAFQFQSELMIDDSAEFIKMIDKSNTIKMSMKGSKNKKVYTFDNRVKDYQ